MTKIVLLSETSRAPLSGARHFLMEVARGMAPELNVMAPPEPDSRRSHLNGTFVNTFSNASLRRGGRRIQDCRTILVMHPGEGFVIDSACVAVKTGLEFGMKYFLQVPVVLVLLMVFPFPAAHGHSVEGGGLMSGMSHPVLGLDHLLAMVCVGVLSARMGGRAVWSVPAVFVGVMAVGGLLGMAEVPWMSVEAGIALSVVGLGVAVAVTKRVPTPLALGVVGFFAVFHGHAHGTEMPELASPWAYASGFLLGTAGLHLFGVLLGLMGREIPRGEVVLRFAGGVVAGAGLVFLVG